MTPLFRHSAGRGLLRRWKTFVHTLPATADRHASASYCISPSDPTCCRWRADFRRPKRCPSNEFDPRSPPHSTPAHCSTDRPRACTTCASSSRERHGVTVDEVLITNGAQQALDLIARAVIDEGDVAVVESPAYLGATQVLQNVGASITGVTSDDDGLDTRVLDDMVTGGLRPKLIYVVSNFHNPTGVTLSAARRCKLAEIATRVGALLVDDDPYGELRFAGQAVPPLAAPSLVRVGTVSKVLAPGLRVGWMVGPPWLIDACVRLKQATDLHTSTLTQCVALDLLRDAEWFAEHLSFIRGLYRERAHTLIDALTDRFGDRVAIAPVHGGSVRVGALRRRHRRRRSLRACRRPRRRVRARLLVHPRWWPSRRAAAVLRLAATGEPRRRGRPPRHRRRPPHLLAFYLCRWSQVIVRNRSAGSLAMARRMAASTWYGVSAVAQVQQQHVASAALDESADRSAVVLADDEIAFPMARHRSVLDLGAAFADQNHARDPSHSSAHLSCGTSDELGPLRKQLVSSRRSSPQPCTNND